MKTQINCDMGESFGIYKMGDDEGIMPYITEANVACGFHGSDPNHMRKTIESAKKYGVKIGAHFSLPDLAGFGRREMRIEREEMVNIILYQVGALKSFLDFLQVELNHLKPHGALYGMATRQEPIAQAIADVGVHYKVPIFGLAGTMHEKVYRSRGIDFCAEFFADLDYDDNGSLIITREHDSVSPEIAAARVARVVKEGLVKSINGKDIAVKADTVCIHSDTPNAVEVAKAVSQVVKEL